MSVKAYLVGGAVRDSLLGIKSKDMDYAVVADDYPSMLSWIRSRGKVFLESPEHFTVRAHLEGKQPADFVLCRKEGPYSDGRRPDYVTAGSLMDDLARRDFTVNAIAYDEETGEYIDPFMGKFDLQCKMLRCVGEPKDRFHEDALRMLRAMRFHITKGFQIHSSVQEALQDDDLLRKLYFNISSDRKRDELRRCFAHDPTGTMKFLVKQGDLFMHGALHTFQQPSIWLEPTSKEP